MRLRSRSSIIKGLRITLYLFSALFLFCFYPGMKEADAGSLVSVAPEGASPYVTVDITGTGFDPVASNNKVIFTDASGVSAANTPRTVISIDPGSNLSRLAVPVPGSLPYGRAAIKVINNTTGEGIDGLSIDVVGITLEEMTPAAKGTNLDVRIAGTPNLRFVAGETVASFGEGVKINSETVESPTSIVANITVSPSTEAGTRSIGVMTKDQTAVLLYGFTVESRGLPAFATASAPLEVNPAAAPAPPIEMDHGAGVIVRDYGDTFFYSQLGAESCEAPPAMTMTAYNAGVPASYAENKTLGASGKNPPAQPKSSSSDDKEFIAFAEHNGSAGRSADGSEAAPLASAGDSGAKNPVVKDAPVSSTPARHAAAAPLASAGDSGAKNPVVKDAPVSSTPARYAAAEPGISPVGAAIPAQALTTAVKNPGGLVESILPWSPFGQDGEGGVMRRMLLAFLAPFILIGYLIFIFWR